MTLSLLELLIAAKKHGDLSSEDPKQICKSMHRGKPKDPHEDGLDESSLSTDEIDDKELEKILVLDNYEYTKTRKLGKKVYEIINNRELDEDSLRPGYKEALDLYMKKSVESFPENIEFKPWQISILEEVEKPTERKLIWVVGKLCGEGKT